jgi:hypothetical protein
MKNGGKGLGSVDTGLVLMLGVVLGVRFRDIGWLIWIGPSFLIVTTLVLPPVAFRYALMSRPAPAEFLQWLNWIGLITAPFNLLLLVVAGCMPSRSASAK